MIGLKDMKPPAESMGIDMRTGWSLTLAAAALVGLPANAQVPDEFLQASAETTVAPQVFHEDERGGVGVMWSLIRSPNRDGLGCSVVFKDAGGLVWISGPADASERDSKTGWLSFGGGTIPPSAKPGQATVTVRSNGATQIMRALHVSLSDTQHMLRIPVNIRDLIAQNDRNMDVNVEMDGRAVFASQIVELGKAYAQLEACMHNHE